MDNNILTQGTPEQPVRLFFDARKWNFNPDCKDNVGSRSFMNGPDGTLGEAFTIGDWSWHWTEIRCRNLLLEKNTPHLFTFWLNGGENDNNNEVCRFEVIFSDDDDNPHRAYDNRYTYNLNRNFIKPLKKLNGWELYEIPFITRDNVFTELRFVAQYAYMTVTAAKEPSAYADIPDTVDEFEELRPQRHNIVFGDGWPINKWYSTRNLRASKEQNNKQNAGNNVGECGVGIRESLDDVLVKVDAVNGTLGGIPGMVSAILSEAINSSALTRQKVTEAVFKCGAENPDEIAQSIMEAYEDKLDALKDAISDNIEAMSDQIETMLNGVESSLDEVRDAVEDS